MKRFTGLLSKTKSRDAYPDLSTTDVDSPEANAARATRLFCESGAPSNGGEEVLHLPVLVEAAESSPAAAASAAQQIRKFLSREWATKPHVQYNAIMLVRILSDNPGATFTRNFDKSFVTTVKELLRSCKDPSTQQILRESLDNFEVSKQHDEGLQPLLQMWRKEKGQNASLSGSGSRGAPPPQTMPQARPGQSQNPYQNVYWNAPRAQQQPQPRARHGLPPPHELASRIEEARNTAKILLQLITSTPTEEIMQNELVKEFSERCQSAQRSMQGYINCDDPSPDFETLQTLIETNEQLSLAGSRYQRALLAARRSMGTSPSPNPTQHSGMSNQASAPQWQDQRDQRQGSYLPTPPPQNQGGAGFGYGYVPPRTTSDDSFGSKGPRWQDHRNSRDRPSGFMPTPPQNQNGTFAQGYQPPRMSSQDSHEADSIPAPLPQQPYFTPHAAPFSPSEQAPELSNPFADPMNRGDSPAPLASEPANYGSPTRPRTQGSGGHHSHHSSRAFSIDSEPLYGSTPPTSAKPNMDRHTTADLENVYSSNATPVSREPSPTLTRHTRSPSQDTPPIGTTTTTVSPQQSPRQPYQQQQQRPSGPGPYHNSVTPSYINRQTSALNGLTMHGAQASEENVAEIDGNSTVGRKMRDPVAAATPDGGPITGEEVRTAQQARRVDVAGTGGLRSSWTRQ